MDENSAVIESILREDDDNHRHHHLNGSITTAAASDDGGWQTVKHAKKNRKPSAKNSENFSDQNKLRHNGDRPDVFRSIELHSEERRQRDSEARKAAAESYGEVAARSKQRAWGDDDDESDEEGPGGVANGVAEVKKVKVKKPKKPKVTAAEAAAKIDASDLETFLVDVSASYESQQDIQLMRFADYFGRAFASVSSSQFPWMKTLKESSVAKMVDIPISHISEAVYKTSVDWINQRSAEALSSFVLWSLDSILADLTSHQGTVKGSKKVVQQTTSKSQVAIFAVLAMALRRKPDVLISILPTLKENAKYLGQEKLPVAIWMIVQASQGDITVALYMWIHFLLPMLSGKSCNPQSRDLILQLVERILSSPKARPILINGAVKKGERLVPPSALELLMRATFPPTSARLKATERFEAIYPTLKEVALAGVPGSKAMKQVSQQTLSFAIKAAGEDIPELSREASDIVIWCLTQNTDCYNHWDKIYVDSIGASAVVLKKLSDEWKEHSVKLASLDHLRDALKSFKSKNEKALEDEEDAAIKASFKTADKYCKVLLGRVSRGIGCVKGTALFTLVAALVVAVVSQNMTVAELKEMITFP